MTDVKALTKQVREASDIVAVVGSYLSLQPAGHVFKGVCPFHNDTRPSLQVDPKWQNFRCWACGQTGDVFTFVELFEKMTFKEAREILARRAGIDLSASPVEGIKRGIQLDAVKWAEEMFRECLLETPMGERARVYLGGRKLTGQSVRAFGLGYAPAAGDWLVGLAEAKRKDLAVLRDVGVVGDKKESNGYYDRFKDRVMFPIRDMRGQTVGFGGRILPDSPLADRGPKYYNSSETPLFLKKELLYGLDIARHAGVKDGYLAVVEGYTDVMMAHQCGVTNVVATMGTALNESHVRQLRRFVPKVVLVFDADKGGTTGVDRALEIFVGCDVELAIATLPDGLDPCDMLATLGAEPFRRALTTAADALDFKLTHLLDRAGTSVEGTKRVVDEILAIMAMAPELPGQAGRVKQELLVTRIAHRLGLRQETVWARFGELKAARKRDAGRYPSEVAATPLPVRSAPADPLEKQLLEVLLAEPALVSIAYTHNNLRPEEIEHPGLQKLLAGLYQLLEAHLPPDLDGLRELIPQPELIRAAMALRENGQSTQDRRAWFNGLLARWRDRDADRAKRQLKDRLTKTASDAEAIELLRQLQGRDDRGSWAADGSTATPLGTPPKPGGPANGFASEEG